MICNCTKKSPPKEQWLRVGWLIDGQGGPHQHDMSLCINDGLITHVGPFDSSCSVSHDLSHATVLPALMDAHVHLVFSGTTDTQQRSDQLKDKSLQIQSVITEHLRAHWRHGISAVRDGGDRRGDVLQYKITELAGNNLPVHVAATCWAWHAKGRYGSMVGKHPGTDSSLPDRISDDLRTIDHIKVIQSGLNSIDRFGHQGGPQFPREVLQEVVKRAHASNKPVMVHANGEAAVHMAIEANCDSIEHGYFMGDDNLKRMADIGISWVPTVVPMAAMSVSGELSQAQQDVARRTVDHQLAQIQKAHSYGVTIVLGTDAGSYGVDHGIGVSQELALLNRAGLPLEQSIRAASLNTARLMGLYDRGVLIPGQRADMIVASGPAVLLPESLSNIDAVIIKGVFFDIRQNG